MKVIMTGEERRKEILKELICGDKPVSGTEFANRFQVSRQVIVQDIALLRAVNKNILSTNKGYCYFASEEDNNMIQRSLKVYHKDADMEDELNTIVDFGAKLLDVVVEHEIYGQINVDLILQNREDVQNFLNKIKTSKSRTLNILTDGIHYHTIEALQEETLDKVENKLREKGYLIY